MSPIKRNVKKKISPSAQCRSIFCLGIQPNCLNVRSYSESGLPQAKGFALSPGLKRRSNRSSLWFHFAVVTAPIVFLKHNKPNRCPPDESYKKECQEKNLPFGSMPVDFLSRHSAQLPERALLL